MVCKPRRLSSWAKSLRGSLLVLGITARKRSTIVVLNSLTAFGCFYMAWSRDLGPSPEAATHKLLKCLGADGDSVGFKQPDAHSFERGKPLRLLQLPLQVSNDGLGQRGR